MMHQPKCWRSGEALEESFVLKTESLLEQPWQDIMGPVFKHLADGSLWFCRWPSRDLVHICVFMSLTIIYILSSLVRHTNLCIILLFFSQLFPRPPQTAILLFCISFSWGCSWFLTPVQCHEPLSIVNQALSLSDLVLKIYLSFPLYNHKGFDLDHTWMV